MKLIKTIVLFALLTLFAGCTMFNEPENANPAGGSGDSKIAQVDVTIGGNARTILPNVTFSKYTLSAKSADDGYTGAVPSPVEITDGTWGTMSLPYGAWIITATAYVSVGGTDYSVAKGRAPLYVYEDSHNIEIVIIAPESGGTGTFTYKVTYSAGGSASVELRPIAGGELVVDEPSVASGALGSSSVPSGIYFLTVKATASGKTVTRNEVVHIYDQSTTEADYVFTKPDFGGILTIGGTIKLLVNGEQPADGYLIITYAGGGSGASINFTGTDGSGTWEGNLDSLHGATTLNFRIYRYPFGERDILTIPVPVDDETDIDLGTVNIDFETTALTADSWTAGDFSENFIDYKLYSMNVTEGQTYYLWWNDSGQGDGTKTADIAVYAYYNDLSSISFNDNDSAWYEPASFTAKATGIVYLSVHVQQWGNYPYTYAIACSANSSSHDVPFVPPKTPVPLTAEAWTDGNISVSYDEDWYSINVTEGQDYYIWLNDLYGDGSKTLEYMDVSAYRSTGGRINLQSTNINSPCPSTRFTADSTGTVYIKVSGWDVPGTYAIGYSDEYEKHPPVIPFSSIPLTANTWTDGYISGSNHNDWYSFNVTEGQQYYIWGNDSYSGDGSKTLDYVLLYAYRSTGDSMWMGFQSGLLRYAVFTADSTGPIYLRVRSQGTSGTYAIAYSDEYGGHPPINLPPSTPLTADVWFNKTSSSYGELDWYSINVTEGQTYYLWKNDLYEGDGTKTLSVYVSVSYSNGIVIFSNYYWDGWNYAAQFTADSTGTVYLRVQQTAGEIPGTYAIAYSSNDNRPEL